MCVSRDFEMERSCVIFCLLLPGGVAKVPGRRASANLSNGSIHREDFLSVPAGVGCGFRHLPDTAVSGWGSKRSLHGAHAGGSKVRGRRPQCSCARLVRCARLDESKIKGNRLGNSSKCHMLSWKRRWYRARPSKSSLRLQVHAAGRLL
ncbi:unnamed protein product [Ectocarpus sp. 12 AP-2014]